MCWLDNLAGRGVRRCHIASSHRGGSGGPGGGPGGPGSGSGGPGVGSGGPGGGDDVTSHRHIVCDDVTLSTAQVKQ